MKIVLSDLNKLLFPECYMYTADRFKNEKAYLQDINADHYLAGTRNIKLSSSNPIVPRWSQFQTVIRPDKFHCDPIFYESV